MGIKLIWLLEIKIGWKKGLREWYTANNYQTTSMKEYIAPLSKTVIDTCAKSETLIKGFCVSGLYLFEVNTRFQQVSNKIQLPKDDATLPEVNVDSSRVLTYSEFCDLIETALSHNVSIKNVG